jgi:arylmalonate decarboxylase
MSQPSRRDFLRAGLTGAALALGASHTTDAAAEPVLGMIFPPADYPVPPEALRLYPSGVKFLAKGVGLEAMTPDSFDKAIPRVIPAAEALVKEGATAISVMGTSLTFYKGRAFNEELTARVAKATGVPVTTMSTGIVEGLRLAKAHRLAVATAYNVEVTERLSAFLREYGFEIDHAKGLGIERIPPGGDIIDNTLQDFCAGVYAVAKKADTLLISCGGLKTLDLIVPLEKKCGVPVVSSTPHALMTGVRLLGLSGRANGFGRVLDNA